MRVPKHHWPAFGIGLLRCSSRLNAFLGGKEEPVASEKKVTLPSHTFVGLCSCLSVLLMAWQFYLNTSNAEQRADLHISRISFLTLLEYRSVKKGFNWQFVE